MSALARRRIRGCLALAVAFALSACGEDPPVQPDPGVWTQIVSSNTLLRMASSASVAGTRDRDDLRRQGLEASGVARASVAGETGTASGMSGMTLRIREQEERAWIRADGSLEYELGSSIDGAGGVSLEGSVNYLTVWEIVGDDVNAIFRVGAIREDDALGVTRGLRVTREGTNDVVLLITDRGKDPWERRVRLVPGYYRVELYVAMRLDRGDAGPSGMAGEVGFGFSVR